MEESTLYGLHLNLFERITCSFKKVTALSTLQTWVFFQFGNTNTIIKAKQEKQYYQTNNTVNDRGESYLK